MSEPGRVINFPVESPLERAMHSTTCAIEDLDAAIWQAETVIALHEVRAVIEQMIARLIVSSSVALTRTEYPQ